MDDDDPRVGHPRTSRTLEHIVEVRTALADNQHSMIRMLAKRFHIDKKTVCEIITQGLGKKSCVRFVPHVQMSEQWEDRKTSCCDFL